MRNKSKKMKGGLLEGLFGYPKDPNNQYSSTSSSNSWWPSWPSWISGTTQNTSTPMYQNTSTPMYQSTNMDSNMYQNNNMVQTGMGYGGKKRKSKRNMKGGYTPTTGLAAQAAPFSGPTAKPHNWVGGKTRRRSRKGSKTRKH